MDDEKYIEGPYWTKNWIDHMWRFTNENFVDFDTNAVDFEALGREEYNFRKALFFKNFKNSERAKKAYVETAEIYKIKARNGKNGGRPKKIQADGVPSRREAEDGDHVKIAARTTISNALSEVKRGYGEFGNVNIAVAPSTAHKNSTPTTSDIYDFARENNLDEVDARDWYEMTYTDRGGKDINGNKINNWKAACRNFCIARAKKRNEQ